MRQSSAEGYENHLGGNGSTPLASGGALISVNLGSSGTTSGRVDTSDPGQAGAGATSSVGGATSGVECQDDSQCTSPTRRCLGGACVECLDHTDCQAGSLCENHACTDRTPCVVASECPTNLPQCDSARGLCVRCNTNADCPATHICSNNLCKAELACKNNLDCGNPLVCDAMTERCVACIEDGDCGAASGACRRGSCVTRCSSNAQCNASAPQCDATGACVACLSHNDCSSTEFCQSGSCVLDRCLPGESRCSGNGIESCNSVGDAYGAAVACLAGQICMARLGQATCVDSSQSGGTAGAGPAETSTGSSGSSSIATSASDPAGAGATGSSRGGSSSGGAANLGGGGEFDGASGKGGISGSASEAAPGGGAFDGGAGAANLGDSFGGAGVGGETSAGGEIGVGGETAVAGQSGVAGASATSCAGEANPCRSPLVRFVKGSQTVDGFDDDFCNVPWFGMSFVSADTIFQYKGTFEPSRYPERVVARVAWSPYNIHAFIHVIDPYVVAAQALDYVWGADSVEFMISIGSNLTGSTAHDEGTLHITAAPWKTSSRGMAAIVRTSGNSATHEALPDDQYYVRLTDDGYSVELDVRWPNGMTANASSPVRFDLALNAAVEGLGDDPNVRDAQAIYVMGRQPLNTTCVDTLSPYCDDRLWCNTQFE